MRVPLSIILITVFPFGANAQVEKPPASTSNSSVASSPVENAHKGAERAEKLMRAVAQTRESLETGTVTISIEELGGEKINQLATFDLTRVQFIGQTASGRRSGDAAMWDGDAVTEVSQFGRQGVRIIETGTSPTLLFDPRCIGFQGPLSQSSSIEEELSLAKAKSFELVAENEVVDGTATVVIKVNYTDGFGEKEYGRQFWIAETEGFPVVKQKLIVGHFTYYESNSTYSKESSVFPLPEKTVLTGFGSDGSKAIEYTMSLSKGRYNFELEKDSFTYKSLGVLPRIPVTDERIHRQIGIWDGNKLVPFDPK